MTPNAPEGFFNVYPTVESRQEAVDVNILRLNSFVQTAQVVEEGEKDRLRSEFQRVLGDTVVLMQDLSERGVLQNTTTIGLASVVGRSTEVFPPQADEGKEVS